MHRARARDQRFFAGICCIALEKCLSIGSPAGPSIAREDARLPSVSLHPVTMTLHRGPAYRRSTGQFQSAHGSKIGARSGKYKAVPRATIESIHVFLDH